MAGLAGGAQAAHAGAHGAGVAAHRRALERRRLRREPVLKLTEAQFIHAFGLAATQASGFVEMLGSQARVLNAGFAARNGMNAALLASQGFEGPARPLEGLRGFFNVFGGSKDMDRLTEGLGKHWEMTQVAYKPYPSGVVGLHYARQR